MSDRTAAIVPPDVQQPPEPGPAAERPVLLRVVAFALVGLLVLAVFYTLYFARSLFIPIALAILLSLLLAPLIGRLARLGIPESIGAALVLIGLLAGLAVAFLQLSGPAADWIARAPESVAEIRQRLWSVVRAVSEVQRATEQVEEMAAIEDESTPAVVVRGPSLTEIFLSGTGRVAASILIMIVLLYFMLASGDLFLRKLVKVLPRLRDKKRAVEIARQTQSDISLYLVTITLINAGLGTITAVAMYLIGLPSPVLWGAMAAVLNFIPYLGSAITISVLALVGLLTFDSFGQAAIAPLVFLCFTTLEGNVITPILLGRRLTLNPVVIFGALMVWGWMWGIPGVLLSVPLLAAFKIVCDNIESLQPIGEFMGRREERG